MKQGPRTRTVGLLAAASIAMVGFVAAPAIAGSAPGQIVPAGTAEVVPNSYVVVFKDTVAKDGSAAKANDMTARYGGRTGHVFREALRGFEVSLAEADARRLAADPAVAYVQRNGVYRIDAGATQAPTPSWGLDRVDQRSLPLNSSYTYPTVASSVTAYVIDTGIRFTHTEFGGRAVSGFDAVDGGSADDEHGHGTHVAGTIGGKKYGVAKNVKLVGVRVLDSDGFGTTADVVAGIDWVTSDHKTAQAAVANMSLGGPIDTAIDTAVRNSIADGIVYGLAAGNSNVDACTQSPARVSEAITVGATTKTDARASFSNFGTCVDIFAPGENIVSAWRTSDTATNTISGTSMATPHVVGAAAVVLARLPYLTVAGVRNYLVATAGNGKVTNPGSGSPNKLLYVENLMPASVGVSFPYQKAPTSVGGPVTVSWTDSAVNEDGFSVERANGGGHVVDVATVDKTGAGATYSIVDFNPVQGGRQCYWIRAFANNGTAPGISEALCVGD